MPDQIEIISYGGAERSIKLDDLRAGKRIHARRYRNPRLGEFLKELHLTEGRGTGFPAIHESTPKSPYAKNTFHFVIFTNESVINTAVGIGILLNICTDFKQGESTT